MSELIPWMDKEINKMRRDMERLFDRYLPDIGAELFLEDVSCGISFDTTSTKDAISIRAVIPGVDPESLDISLADDKLTIKGRKKSESVEGNGFYQRVERKLCSFSRTIPLPFRADTEEIRATLNKGILNILVPRWKPEKARLIKVKTA